MVEYSEPVVMAKSSYPNICLAPAAQALGPGLKFHCGRQLQKSVGTPKWAVRNFSDYAIDGLSLNALLFASKSVFQQRFKKCDVSPYHIG
jgi:hypothetical protein